MVFQLAPCCVEGCRLYLSLRPSSESYHRLTFSTRQTSTSSAWILNSVTTATVDQVAQKLQHPSMSKLASQFTRWLPRPRVEGQKC